LTVLGPPVNVAVNLVDMAVRDRSVIAIDEAMYHALAGRIDADKLPQERLGKAAAFTASAYDMS